MSRFQLASYGCALGALGLVAACSASGSHAPGALGHGSASSGGDQDGAGGSPAGAGTGGLGLGSDVGGPPGAGSDTCAAAPYQATQLPLDMYVMEDQSASMSDMVSGGGTKWEAVTGALTSFVQQSGLTGISVGLQYFGLPASGMAACPSFCFTTADCGSGCGSCVHGFCSGGGGAAHGDSCDPSDYATPSVEIAPLPAVGSMIAGSLGAHSPSTSTPTGPALQGALDHAKTWATAHPGHVVIAVLATDGQPTECSPTDHAGLAQIAADALAGTPSVKTFTIGVFAPSDIPSGPALLDDLAAAGGTGQAFNIQTSNQDVGQQFLAALNAIRGSALGCQYGIPMGVGADPTKLNVQYSPGSGGAPEIFGNVGGVQGCSASGDGWYYDDAAAPTQVLLCPATCTKVGADATGTLDILLGCATQTTT